MTNPKPTNLERVIYHMMLENTGTHFLDSGGKDGRHWQKNQGKSIHDFISEPAVEFEMMVYQQINGEWQKVRVENTEEIEYTISVFHYLTNGALDLDFVCEEFNHRPVKDWDFETAYGVSKQSGEWLMSLGAEFGASFNTYNYASALSQVLQGTNVTIMGKDYILLQIHGGCDVRGGYTDAKLFKLSDLTEGYMPLEDVVGVVIKPDKMDKVTTPIFNEPSRPEPIWISNNYDGYRLTDENGAGVEIGVEDTVELFLAECG